MGTRRLPLRRAPCRHSVCSSIRNVDQGPQTPGAAEQSHLSARPQQKKIHHRGTEITEPRDHQRFK
jgi:hypothetical protein